MRKSLLQVAAGIAAIAMAVGAGISTSRIHAQTQPTATPAPAFEVASVKVNKSGDNRAMFGIQPGGRFTITNVPLRQIIGNAYDVQGFRIEGGPSWIGTERYDILAKTEGGVDLNRELIGPMLRTLLADRFKLKAHMEMKELPVYELVLARSDKKLGPKMGPAAVDCAAMFAARGRGGAPPPPPPQAGERMQCGIRMSPASMAVGGMPIAQLAIALSQQVNRVVIDRTGLTGNFDLELAYAPEFLGRGGLPPEGPGANAQPVASDAPSLFTALQEQAGLKLEAQRAPIEVLVIDSVEHPTED